MSKYAVMPLSDYDNACDKIREKTETAEPIKSGEFAGKVEDVYNEGLAEGIEQGKEIGAKAEYNKLWNGVQNYGNRTNYEYAFFGETWNDNTFYPKYDMILSDGYAAGSMFRTSLITNLKQRLEECGVVLDTSKTQAFNTMFYGSTVEIVPTLDMRSATEDTNLCFANCYTMTTIEKLVFSEKTVIIKMFVKCNNLQNVIFEGVIAQNGLDLQWCTKLSRASWQSIISVLSANTSGLSMTGSLASVNKAFETSTGANDGSTSTEWLNLIATKPNWTINLV